MSQPDTLKGADDLLRQLRTSTKEKIRKHSPTQFYLSMFLGFVENSYFRNDKFKTTSENTQQKSGESRQQSGDREKLCSRGKNVKIIRDAFNLSLYVYRQSPEEKKELGLYKWEDIIDHKESYPGKPVHSVMRDQKDGTLWVALRGTDEYCDVLSDMDIKPKSYLDGRIQHGIYSSAEYITSVCLEVCKIKRCPEVILTGHSYGGSVAAIAAGHSNL